MVDPTPNAQRGRKSFLCFSTRFYYFSQLFRVFFAKVRFLFLVSSDEDVKEDWRRRSTSNTLSRQHCFHTTPIRGATDVIATAFKIAVFRSIAVWEKNCDLQNRV